MSKMYERNFLEYPNHELYFGTNNTPCIYFIMHLYLFKINAQYNYMACSTHWKNLTLS